MGVGVGLGVGAEEEPPPQPGRTVTMAIIARIEHALLSFIVDSPPAQSRLGLLASVLTQQPRATLRTHFAQFEQRADKRGLLADAG